MLGPLLARDPADVSQREQGQCGWNARGAVSGGAVRKRQGGRHTEPQARPGRCLAGGGCASGSPLSSMNTGTGEWSPPASAGQPRRMQNTLGSRADAEDRVEAGSRDRRKHVGPEARRSRAGGLLGMQRRECQTHRQPAGGRDQLEFPLLCTTLVFEVLYHSLESFRLTASLG